MKSQCFNKLQRAVAKPKLGLQQKVIKPT